MIFIRTCQECGYEQKDKDPEGKPTTRSYENRKCKKCKSESLDYGSQRPETPEEKESAIKFMESYE